VAYYENNPVGFTSYLHFPHDKIKNMKREHRMVVLPDYQGVGIGNALSEFIARKVVEQGLRFGSVTNNPAMINYRNKSKNWKLKSFGRKKPGYSKITNKTNSSFKRLTTSWEYVI